MSNLLTPKEVAEMLKISVKTIYEWAKEDKLPSIKLFNEIRFRRSEIENICKNGLQKPERESNIVKPKTNKRRTKTEELMYWERPRAKLRASD